MKRILLILIPTLVAVGSCTKDFDTMNVDPNNPTAVGPQYAASRDD